MQQEVGEAARSANGSSGVGRDGIAIQGGRVDVHALARLHQVHNDQAQHQCERGENLEVDQGPGTDTAELLHVFHFGDAENHGCKDDRCKNHLDQFDEGITQWLHVCADLRPEHA
ncbi:hypothetical protein D9M71_617630 [compost metagenome]